MPTPGSPQAQGVLAPDVTHRLKDRATPSQPSGTEAASTTCGLLFPGLSVFASEDCPRTPRSITATGSFQPGLLESVPQKSPSDSCSERAKLSIPVSSDILAVPMLGAALDFGMCDLLAPIGEFLGRNRTARGVVVRVADDPLALGGPAPKEALQARLF